MRSFKQHLNEKDLAEAELKIDMSRMKPDEKKRLIDIVQSLQFKRNFKLTFASVSLGKYLVIKTSNILIGKAKDEIKKMGYQAVNWRDSTKLVMEGTWASPDTLKKRQQLKVLLRKPIKGKDATDVLGDILGDDSLWDDLDDAKNSPDVRPIIIKYLKTYGPTNKKSWADIAGIK